MTKIEELDKDNPNIFWLCITRFDIRCYRNNPNRISWSSIHWVNRWNVFPHRFVFREVIALHSIHTTTLLNVRFCWTVPTMIVGCLVGCSQNISLHVHDEFSTISLAPCWIPRQLQIYHSPSSYLCQNGCTLFKNPTCIDLFLKLEIILILIVLRSFATMSCSEMTKSKMNSIGILNWMQNERISLYSWVIFLYFYKIRLPVE